MVGLTEGRDVHYVDAQGTHLAAKIVMVSDRSKRIISAFVYPVRPGEVGGVIENVPFVKSTKEEPVTKPLSWHWVERVD